MIKNCLVVVGRMHYPKGSAPANRSHLYCKALKQAGGFPVVINLNSPFESPQSFSHFGVNEGVCYLYSQGSIFREPGFLKRNFNKLKGIVRAFSIIRRLNKTYNVKMLFFSTSYFYEVIFFLFSRITGIKTIRELNEAPVHILKGKRQSLLDKMKERIALKMYDRILVISDKLFNYYLNFFPKEKIFQIPILVDMERFERSSAAKKNGKTILTYVGYMGGNKDGLPDLINSVKLVKNKNENFILQLVGTAEPAELAELNDLVNKLQLKEQVFFAGKQDTLAITSILKNSDVLLLARPDNKQAEYGFATKLGEYLASAKPVVVTNTGEIYKYLRHKENAYIAEPGNIQDFSEKVIDALNDPERAKKIGHNGYAVANEHFNYKLFKNKMLALMES